MYRVISVVYASLLILWGIPILQAQSIQWMTFEEAIEAQQSVKKKVFVDIYTDWCSWCKKMDQTTFHNKVIADYINEHYYPVKFNAESNSDITFKGNTYEFVRQGRRGYHQLAVELTQGRLSFPTVVFLDENLHIIQALRGFQSSLRFEQIMTYFAQDYYKTTPWSTYSENYHTVINKN